MPKFQVASDLHVEFDSEDGIIPQADTLILAGDIAPFDDVKLLARTYYHLSKKFKKIIHIPGNHEYYHSADMRQGLKRAREIASRYDISILDNETIDIDNVRIIGSTLWSHIPEEHKKTVGFQMNDYRKIRLEDRVLTPDDTVRFHRESVGFIEKSIGEAVAESKIPVVVTHHAPSKVDTGDSRYTGTASRYAFSTDLSYLFSGVRAWIFGHTHYAVDRIEGSTRLVSNPKGYPGEIQSFNPGLILEID